MSDKTEMVKLRVTPDEKARWQQEAERQGIGLSELIRSRMNEAQPRAGCQWPQVVDDGSYTDPADPLRVAKIVRDFLVEHGLENSGLAAKIEDLTTSDQGVHPLLVAPTSDCHNHQCSLKGCASCDYRTVGAPIVDGLPYLPEKASCGCADCSGAPKDVPTTEPTDSVEYISTNVAEIDWPPNEPGAVFEVQGNPVDLIKPWMFKGGKGA